MQDSSPIVIDQTTQDRSGEHDWDELGGVPAKPKAYDYGYVLGGKAIGCSPEELSAALVAHGPANIKLVWTPETSDPVLPEKARLLVSAFKRLSVKAANQSIYWGLGLITFGVVLAVVLNNRSLLYRNIFSIFGALALVEGTWQRIQTRHYTQEDAEADVSTLRFVAWVEKKKISGYTFGLAAYIVVVGIFQGLAGAEESIKSAGLVKPAVWDGQVWRLLTACLMHASFMHFWMNFLVLLHFGKIVEQTTRRAYVPLIFLGSGVFGSIFSVLLYPNSMSVGASGGLMGLLGFITMAAHFDKKNYPPGYLRNSIEAIVMIGVFGLFGFAFIDNAAHLGGLCGGLLLGWMLLGQYNQKSNKEKVGKRMVALGAAALVILGLAASIAIFKILR